LLIYMLYVQRVVVRLIAKYNGSEAKKGEGA